MPFTFERLEIPDVSLIEAKTFPDDRGFFMEAYRQDVFSARGIPDQFVQDNYSHSVRGVLRGLHYQKAPKAQAKLVYVVHGEIFDVEVDMRRGSPTYGKWIGVTLSSKNRRMLYVPVGFAHGFCVLSDAADVIYKVSEPFDPALDRGIVWDDPEVGIAWPVQKPILSEKDTMLPSLAEADHDFVFSAK